MKDLVIMQDQQAVTTSLRVAESFGKGHKHVLESIDKKIQSAENSADYQKMFAEGSYKDSRGRNQKMYYMNRDGFTFIAFGFTGKKADKFKLKYISAFNKMEAAIRSESKPLTIPEQIQTIAKGYNALEADFRETKADVSDIKNRMGLPGNMKRTFTKARNRKVIELMGGSNSNAYLDKSLRQSVYQLMFASFKSQFDVDAYADCPMKDFDAAIEFVNNWFLPYETQTKVQQLNAQTGLFDDDDEEA